MAYEDRPNADPGRADTSPPEATTASTGVSSVAQTPTPPPVRKTLAGRVWVAIVVAAILLIALIIFIAQNSQGVTISFLGAQGRISLALAILIAAVAGVLITLLVGSTRILQLRLEVQRHRRRAGSGPSQDALTRG